MPDNRTPWLSPSLALALLLPASVALSQVPSQPETSPAPVETIAVDTIEPVERPCLEHTGTRIEPLKRRCIGAPGRVYDRADIDRTGDTDVGRALERLDPSIRVR